ncbi:GGDEF domain-containing protein [Rhodanobacter sp. C01]|uniref:tetratricopeptide repeat-containing diguanylate cyclase n=1 Tax=Rhodanobacter sp. C01 TaxID=1945856 RepID=UPI000985CC81|nr:GGDEF domain-containing protein [Rhodanobacter sp. C01]OOG49073.1 GGDEF domain-containing protein [Rhodanobacter sp. C01]
MFLSSRQCWAGFAGGLLLMAMLTGTAVAAVPASDDSAQLLKQADSVKTSNHAEFLQLISRLAGTAAKLSPSQRMYLHFLQAWEVCYQGDYEAATPLLNAIIAEPTDAILRFRAGLTLVNTLVIGSHYEDAFARMRQLLDQLPQIVDKDARIQALGVAGTLYNEAGQYDLGLNYANKMLRENPDGRGDCKGRFLRVQSIYESGKFSTFEKESSEGIDACNKASDFLFGNLIRAYVAGSDIQHGQSAAAIKLLQKNYADVQHIGYPELTSQFDASLAQAYWNEGEIALAQQYAHAAVDGGVKHEFTKSQTSAYELLYLIAKKQGDLDAALSYHEKYMAADKGYLNEVSAKALAYQAVEQQVQAKKLQIDTLNKQNEILQLQQKLAKKAAVASRLYIALLVLVLASIALWTYKIKRSQLRFMKLARRDGLTGIFNRQHFLNEAGLQLQYCRKSSRGACLVLIDLDHFKTVNDTHGHAVGDRVLQRAVEACKAHLRSTDIFGRLGGEEFGILLPEYTLEQVLGRAEQIRLAIATAAAGEDAPGIPVSASFGVSSVVHSGYELRQLLIHADEALYRAKREGRNRVSASCSETREAYAQAG